MTFAALIGGLTVALAIASSSAGSALPAAVVVASNYIYYHQNKNKYTRSRITPYPKGMVLSAHKSEVGGGA